MFAKLEMLMFTCSLFSMGCTEIRVEAVPTNSATVELHKYSCVRNVKGRK
jgi:hypothetical protein